jgi:predicted DNA-binding protein
MVVTLRLDAEAERALARVARDSAQTRSAIIRQAIVQMASDLKNWQAQRPYALLADLIGSVRGGPQDLSSRTGESFRRMLIERARVKK